jgi:hypothetical protein
VALPVDEVHALDLLPFLSFIGLIDAQAVNPQQSRRFQVSDVDQCFIQVQRDRDHFSRTADLAGDIRIAPGVGKGRKVGSIRCSQASERDLEHITLDPGIIFIGESLCEMNRPTWRVDFEQANMIRSL